MGTRTCRLGALVLLAAASSATSADPADARIERPTEFLRRVDDAIGRGVAWLKKAQSADGSFADFPGYPGATTALAYHALRECGAARDDASSSKAWDALRRAYRKPDVKTYAAALDLMAIRSHGTGVARPVDDRDVELSADDKKWAEEIAGRLVGGQSKDGTWGYGLDARDPGRFVDNSNTQYALLGLKSAARCGVAVDPSVWKKSLAWFIDDQEPRGPEVPRRTGGAGAAAVDRARGWGYNDRRHGGAGLGTYTAMTAGGVGCVVICRSELLGTREMSEKLDAESRRSAWDGIAWIATHWSTNPFPGASGGARARDAAGPTVDLYGAFGVERAGVLAGVERMGDVDWYGAGAAALLDAQAAQGSWSGRHDNGLGVGDKAAADKALQVSDTCFALLFLAKGTAPVRRGAVVTVADDLDVDFVEAAKVAGKDLEDVVDLVLARWRRASAYAARARLHDGATSIGPKIVEPLLARMELTDADKRAAAHEFLRRATGLDFGWRADAPADARADAVRKWRAWWTGAKDKLVYDPAAKRLVVR